ncbi:hypothetical protein BN948_01901 [Hydrogenophaga intermedia]|uniref:Uncharacterized protein n=1 Tax=Hydrogenophaga intermedia TaxID=65786 RepID=A0A1L1PI97_HYDIT|nr:hypothetical protein BN948_01901 [Hydrogenophaga intermedia]
MLRALLHLARALALTPLGWSILALCWVLVFVLAAVAALS